MLIVEGCFWELVSRFEYEHIGGGPGGGPTRCYTSILNKEMQCKAPPIVTNCLIKIALFFFLIAILAKAEFISELTHCRPTKTNRRELEQCISHRDNHKNQQMLTNRVHFTQG